MSLSLGLSLVSGGGRGGEVVPPIFADYSTGLSATMDAEFFALQSADGFQILIYQKSGSTAVLQYARPNAVSGIAAALAAVNSTTIPSGAIADAVALDNFRALSILPNRAIPGYNILANLLGASRPTSSIIRTRASAAGVTVTWAQTGPDATAEAVKVVYDGTGTDTLAIPLYVPPGQWTLAMDVISNSGSSGDFQIGLDSTRSAVTATTSWSTVSVTLARTANAATVYLFYPPTIAAARDISIDNIRLVPGSGVGSATAKSSIIQRPSVPLRDGLFVANTRSPSNAGAVYRIPFDGQQTLSGYTLSLLVRRSDAALLPETNTLFNFENNAAYSISYPHGTSFFSKFGGLPMIGLPAQEWIVMTYVYRASGESAMWVNGCKVAVATSTAAAIVARYVDLLFFSSNSDALLGGLGSAAWYDSALSDANVALLASAMMARGAAYGSFSDFGTLYIAEGDSITFGRTASPTSAGYAYLIGRRFDPFLQGLNFGVDGSTLGNLESAARFDAAIATIARGVAAGKVVVMSVLIGTNDASVITTNGQADAWYARLVAYWAAMRTAGAKVIASTCVPRNDAGWNESVRTYLNGLIRGNPSAYDGLADYAASALDPWSGTYWADTTHPNNTGHILMADILEPEISAFWIPTPP